MSYKKLEIQQTDVCHVCGSEEKESGSSLHVWDVTFTCGGKIIGYIGHDDIYELIQCTNNNKVMEENLKYRMYGLVPYNLSPIQQGIQFGHAVVEYAQDYGTNKNYKQWASEDKTFIILNGGTTNNNPEKLGSLNQHGKTLEGMGVDIATFNEPDLGDQLTAVVFLVDERVWDKLKYPDLLPIPEWLTDNYEIEVINKHNKVLIEAMGGKHILELREFIQQFKLA